MSEASLWDYLRTVLPAKGHYSRIEAETAQGFPDVHYTLLGQSGSIELKFARNPRKPAPFSGKDEGLRRSQRSWIEEEDAAGGLVWIIAEVDKRIYLVSGNDYFEGFNDFTASNLELLSVVSWTRGKEVPLKALESALSEPL